MDERTFDRLTRLVSAAATRRAGIRAALGAAVGLTVLDEADAGKRGRHNGRGEGANPEGPCTPYNVKNNRCRHDSDCCTNWCEKRKRPGKNAKDGLGRCRCRRWQESCTQDTDCCLRGDQQMLCIDGYCSRGAAPIPTSEPCVDGDTCADPLAECTTYQSENPSGTYCLLAQGESTCTQDDDCITQVCTSGTCGAYQPGLAEVCGASSAQETCRTGAGTCQTYFNSWTNESGDQYYCTLENGESCPMSVGDCACESSGCNDGTCCNTDSYYLNNVTCGADGSCCSNLCKNFAELLNRNSRRCIGTDQLWWRLSYTGNGNDISTMVIVSPDNVPANWNSTDPGPYYMMGPFETSGGGFVDDLQTSLPSEHANTVPTGPGNESYPNGDGDAYCRAAGNVPYTALKLARVYYRGGQELDVLMMHPQPGDKLRVMFDYDDQCWGDSYSVDACGPNWSELHTGTGTIWQQGNPTVTFYRGTTQVGSPIVIQAPPQGTQNPERYYWWWAADVVFDETNTPHVIPVNTLHQCLPIPYALDGGTVTNGLRALPYVVGEQDDSGWTNWCTPVPYLTPTP